MAGKIDAPVSGLKVKNLHNGSIALVLVGQASPNGELYNPEKAPKPLSTVREYSKMYVRFWDHYLGRERTTILYATLSLSNTRYTICDKGLVNALEGTGLEVSKSIFGMDKQYDLSSTGILFLAQDPTLNAAAGPPRIDLYYISLSTFSERDPPKPSLIRAPGFGGSSSSPVFSTSGNSVAFLQNEDYIKYYGKNYLFVIPDISNSSVAKKLSLSTEKSGPSWNLTPSSVMFSSDGKELYLSAEEDGSGKLFKVPSSPTTSGAILVPLSEDGVVSAAHRCGTSSNQLLVTKTNYVDNGIYSLLNPSDGASHLVLSASKKGSAFGLHPSQVSKIYFKGAGNYNVQAWVLKPSDFSNQKTYPLAFLVHGGPVSAWNEGWSTRWNPAVFAEQGYVVVLPNPVGSTGFGQDHIDAIDEQWGGLPYQDLVNCFDYIDSELKFVDTERAVALGASYGGYMMNWIAGQPLAKKFKTLVCHDGVFSMYNMYSSDIGGISDNGGPLSKNKAGWDKWDPAQHTDKWTTPMLFIHSDLDFRCPITDGLAPFCVLQEKGIESRFLNFPDENHWVLKPENSLRWHQTVLGWINKYARVDGISLGPPVSEPHS